MTRLWCSVVSGRWGRPPRGTRIRSKLACGQRGGSWSRTSLPARGGLGLAIGSSERWCEHRIRCLGGRPIHRISRYPRLAASGCRRSATVLSRCSGKWAPGRGGAEHDIEGDQHLRIRTTGELAARGWRGGAGRRGQGWDCCGWRRTPPWRAPRRGRRGSGAGPAWCRCPWRSARRRPGWRSGAGRGAELGQLGEQSGDQHGPDAGHASTAAALASTPSAAMVWPISWATSRRPHARGAATAHWRRAKVVR